MKILILAVLAVSVPRLAHASCSWSTINAVAFGTYDATTNTNTDATGSFTYKCTIGTSITIDLDYGSNGDRTMNRVLGGTDKLAYTLYQDATRLLPWGNTGLTHEIIVSAATSFTQVFVYGRLAKGQNIQVGDYSDTLTVTINY